MIWNSLVKGSRITGANQLKRFMSTEAFKLPATGVNKTYDQALEYLTQHSNSKLAQAKKIDEQLKDAKLDQATKSDLQALKETLLTEAYINLPETQHKFQTGDYNVTEPVYKYLKTQQWNTELKPIIKQRVEQMFVSPDVLHPQSDYLDSHINLSVEEGEFVECGKFIDAEKTIQAPSLSINTFHEATKHYTLVMIDADHPNEVTKTFQQKPHWIIKNIPLSLTQTKVEGETVLNYIPPHPANGTGTHRYSIVLLEQANGDKTELSEFTTKDQALPQFIENNKLTVKGAYFFRSKWSQAVSSIYNDILKIEEPLFGPQPIVNPLVGKDGKLRGRYHNI